MEPGVNKSDIEEWFAELGVPDFSTEASFDSETGLQVDFVLSEDGRELLITIALGPLGAGVDAGVYRLILRSNYLGLETNGGCLSLAEDDETLLLWRVVPIITMDPDALTATTSGLLDAAEELRRRIFNQDADADVRQDTTPPTPMSLA